MDVRSFVVNTMLEKNIMNRPRQTEEEAVTKGITILEEKKTNPTVIFISDGFNFCVWSAQNYLFSSPCLYSAMDQYIKSHKIVTNF